MGIERLGSVNGKRIENGRIGNHGRHCITILTIFCMSDHSWHFRLGVGIMGSEGPGHGSDWKMGMGVWLGHIGGESRMDGSRRTWLGITSIGALNRA
jgi:hypothetical protein